MLHCELLQLPHSIGCGYGWCGMPGIGVCVCVCVCEGVMNTFPKTLLYYTKVR